MNRTSTWWISTAVLNLWIVETCRCVTAGTSTSIVNNETLAYRSLREPTVQKTLDACGVDDCVLRHSFVTHACFPTVRQQTVETKRTSQSSQKHGLQTRGNELKYEAYSHSQSHSKVQEQL